MQTPANTVEYQHAGEPWKCSAFQGLQAEFALPNDLPETLNAFHEVAAACQPMQWLIVRRLFGLREVLPPIGSKLADMKTWPRSELMKDQGLTKAQLVAHLDAVRGAWKQLGERQAAEALKTAEPEPEASVVDDKGQQQLTFRDEALLGKYQLNHLSLSTDEKPWFCDRIREFEKILNEPMAKGLARSALVTELDMHRTEAALHDREICKPGEANYSKYAKIAQDFAGLYRQQINQLAEICPWASELAGKVSFLATMSEVTRAIQEYYADGNTALADGIFTRTEVRVECRRSVQAPDPRYRAGLIVFLNAAKAHLFDPKWEGQIPEAQLKHIDLAWKAAYVAAEDAEGVNVPDLEGEGQKNEYESLVKSAPG